MRKTMSTFPVKVTKQSRSQRTQAAILAIVEKHLREGTFDEVSVHDIVSDAGCSVGAFYGRFSNKAAALYHFYELSCSELEELTSGILDPTRNATLTSILTDFVIAIVNRTFGGASIIRSNTFRAELVDGSPFMERARKMNARVAGKILQCLAARQHEFERESDESTALFVLALVGGLPRDAVLNGASLFKRPRGFDSKRFKRELTETVVGYLRIH